MMREYPVTREIVSDLEREWRPERLLTEGNKLRFLLQSTMAVERYFECEQTNGFCACRGR
jgi:hypothetical protein